MRDAIRGRRVPAGRFGHQALTLRLGGPADAVPLGQGPGPLTAPACRERIVAEVAEPLAYEAPESRRCADPGS